MRQHTRLPFRGKSSTKQRRMRITLLIALTTILSTCSWGHPKQRVLPLPYNSPGFIEHNTPEKRIPNFLDFIYTAGLEAVKPEAVNGIH